MFLNKKSFLDLLLNDRGLQRISLAIDPKNTRELLLLRTVGSPEGLLLSKMDRLLRSFLGRERILSEHLGERVSIALDEDRVRNFSLTLSEVWEDVDIIFELGKYPTLYRDREDLYVTLG